MNVRLLKAKRVEANLRQIDVAKELGISEKTMVLKECSAENKFTASEMIALRRILNLMVEEFLSIFFAGEFTETDKFLSERLYSIRHINFGKEENGDAVDQGYQ